MSNKITLDCSFTLLVDAEIGFGNTLNLKQTVKELEMAPVACKFAKSFPKRCGHRSGNSLFKQSVYTNRLE